MAKIVRNLQEIKNDVFKYCILLPNPPVGVHGTANQDVPTITQKTSSILPMISFKPKLEKKHAAIALLKLFFVYL